MLRTPAPLIGALDVMKTQVKKLAPQAFAVMLSPTTASALSDTELDPGVVPLFAVLIIFLLVILRGAFPLASSRRVRLAVLLGCVGAALAWAWPTGALIYGAAAMIILAAFNLKLLKERLAWYYLGPSPLRVIKEEELDTITIALAMLVPTTISFVLRVIVLANDI